MRIFLVSGCPQCRPSGSVIGGIVFFIFNRCKMMVNPMSAWHGAFMLPIYRYLKAPDAMSFFKTGLLKISDVTFLNDIFDCVFRWKNCESLTKSELEHMLRHFALFKNIGILCYSEKANVFLLWAHYAASHTGVALEFAASEISDFESVEGGPMASNPYRIKYSPPGEDYRPLIHPCDLIPKYRPDRTSVAADVYKTLLTKGHEWSYEEEVREFIKYDDESCLAKETGFYLSNTYPLTKIILGVRCKENPYLIRKLLPPEYKSVPIVRATINNEARKIEAVQDVFEPEPMTDSDYYFWQKMADDYEGGKKTT